MDKKFCEKDICTRCGGCCSHLRNKKIFSKLEDSLIRKAIFDRKGILYRYSQRKYGLGITKAETETMQKEALLRGIKIKIKPKKIFIDENNNSFDYDFFLDHDSCPFYKDNSCSIYEKRPARCRMFPKIENIDEADLKIFLSKFKSKKLTFEEALKIARKKRAS